MRAGSIPEFHIFISLSNKPDRSISIHSSGICTYFEQRIRGIGEAMI
jgi:hypothetical protein